MHIQTYDPLTRHFKFFSWTYTKKYKLTKIINAKGVFTPIGVSRSGDEVAAATGEALKHYFDIEQLLQTAGGIIADSCRAEFATIVHCASAANILSIAATMTGSDPNKIAQLPDTAGMKNKVVISTCPSHQLWPSH